MVSNHLDLTNRVVAFSTIKSPTSSPKRLRETLELSSDEIKGLVRTIVKSDRDQSEPSLGLVVWHLLRAQWVVFVELGSEITSFADWAWENNVLWLSEGVFRDPNGDRLCGGSESADPTAQIPFLVEARQRQTHIGIEMANRLVDVPEGVWPMPASAEVQRVEPEVAARRMLACFVVAVRAEALLSGANLDSTTIRQRCPVGMRELSLQEQQFFDVGNARLAEKFVWRYESLMTLQWALAMQHELPWPDERCDLATVTRLMIELPDKEILAGAKLRPLDQLLTETERHFQAWHAIASAQAVDPSSAPAGLDPGVVAERLVTLLWILQTAAPVRFAKATPPAASWDLTDHWVELGMPLSGEALLETVSAGLC